MSQRSNKPATASRRRSSAKKKKTECFVGVVNLDELNATNGACLPEQLRMVHDDTALMQHALPMPGAGTVGHASRRGSYDLETTMPPLPGGGGGGGSAGSGRSSSMPPNLTMGMNGNNPMHDEPRPYGVPSNFYASASQSVPPGPANRSASMVMMGSMPMYHDVPNQNGKRPSITTSMPVGGSMSVTSMGMSSDYQMANKKAKSGSKKKEDKAKKRWTWKKPKDMPKRPLSAYNLFFATERKRIVAEHEAAISYESDEEPSSVIVATPTTADGKKRIHRRTHGKISFSDLARTIADRWKVLADSDRAPYTAEAAKDKARYDREMAIYNMKKDIEKKKAEQKRLEEIIAAAKTTKGEETSEASPAVEEEKAPADETDEHINVAPEQPTSTAPVPQVQPQVPSQDPTTNNTAFNPFPRTNSLDFLTIGRLLDDDLGFGSDDLVASLNNSRNFDTTGDATALAQAAMAQASSAMHMEQVPIQRLPQPPAPHQPRQAPPTSSHHRPASRSLDMLLEGTSEDRDIMAVGNTSFSSTFSDRSATKKVNKTGASHIGEVSLPTPNVPLLHSAASNGSGGSGGEDSAYSDAQLIQDIMASIDADERYGIGGSDGAPAIPSSLGSAGDLVGNFVRGSAA